jgi:hypothetical protein
MSEEANGSRVVGHRAKAAIRLAQKAVSIARCPVPRYSRLGLYPQGVFMIIALMWEESWEQICHNEQVFSVVTLETAATSLPLPL